MSSLQIPVTPMNHTTPPFELHINKTNHLRKKNLWGTSEMVQGVEVLAAKNGDQRVPFLELPNKHKKVMVSQK